MDWTKILFLTMSCEKYLAGKMRGCFCFSLFCNSIGEIGDLYRPVGNSGELKEFAFVGFYNQLHVQLAVKTKGNSIIGSTPVKVEEAKSWLLELYPKK